MKTNIFTLAAVAALLAGTASCSDDWTPNVQDEGAVELTSLAIDAVDIDKTLQEVNTTVSRAQVDLNDYIVTITDISGKTAPQSFTYGKKPEVLTLPVGDYRLDIISHQVQKAEWGRPLFSGSKEFKIEKSKIANIGVVTCTFASVKVSVVFGADLLEVLGDDAKVTILLNDEGTLEFTPATTESGFFEYVEGSMTMVAKFEGTIDGTKVEEYTPFTDIAAGQHRIVKYGVKAGPEIPEQTGQIDPGTGLELSTEVISEDVAGNVATDEDPISGVQHPWGPEEPENPVIPDDPVVPDDDITFTPSETSTNLKLAPEVNIASEDFGDAVVNIHADKGIAHLVVNIDSDSDNFMASLEGLEFPTTFDLAYTGADGETIGGLGLPVDDEVLNQTDVKFDITSFVGLLASFPGTHTFSVTLTDNANKAKTIQLIFKAN